MSKHYIEMNERKTVFRRLAYTCMLLIIFILGNRIEILKTPNNLNIDSIYKMTASNLGGNLDSINIFSLGLGPWLTSMIFISLYYFKYPKKMAKKTKFEMSLQERLFTLILACIQSYFIVKQAYVENPNQNYPEWIAMLVLVAGCMLLIWIADLNAESGIGGPMPIIFIGIVKSFLSHGNIFKTIAPNVLWIALACILVAFMVLLLLELSEYRIPYLDIMSASDPYQKPYISWKLNPSGSLAMMITISLFISLKYFADFFGHVIGKKHIDSSYLGFSSPIGITIFIVMLFLFGYWLSLFMLGPKQKAEQFQKSGNFFNGIQPGKLTEQFIRKKARRISFIGAFIVALIIGAPLFATLLYPKISQEIYLAIQIIMVIYIALNMIEAIRTLLYFDKYEGFLKKYW